MGILLQSSSTSNNLDPKELRLRLPNQEKNRGSAKVISGGKGITECIQKRKGYYKCHITFYRSEGNNCYEYFVLILL
jgi:hypothetical protein